MRRPQAKRVMERAFAVISEESSYVDGRLVKRVEDCILDYVPAAKELGLNYTPVIFGLQGSGKGGLTLIACSAQIKRVRPDGLRLNDDDLNSVDALMVAATLNRIFERVQKDL